jgi:hypothetical protein
MALTRAQIKKLLDESLLLRFCEESSEVIKAVCKDAARLARTRPGASRRAIHLLPVVGRRIRGRVRIGDAAKRTSRLAISTQSGCDCRVEPLHQEWLLQHRAIAECFWRTHSAVTARKYERQTAAMNDCGHGVDPRPAYIDVEDRNVEISRLC